MSASVESGSYNHVDTGLFQSDGLVRSRRGTDRDDVLAMILFKNFVRRNAVDEREDRHLSIEENTRLIFKAQGLVWCELRLVRTERLKMGS